MARRSALRRPKESSSGLSGEEAPSAFAELWVMKVPLDDERSLPDKAIIPAADLPASGIISMLRRLGIGAGMRVAVPGRDASEMISMIRCVVVSFIWGATTLGTLVIAKAAALPASATVIVVALELAGFCLGLLTARRTRRRDGSLREGASARHRPGAGGHRLILALGPGS